MGRDAARAPRAGDLRCAGLCTRRPKHRSERGGRGSVSEEPGIAQGGEPIVGSQYPRSKRNIGTML
ncbi:hypothetical protein C5O80_18745 [Burkholderia sp. SRS-46]|nr:hypothetical protein C5O80_18745 [Burkholderia sp. SRS-46]